jgi:16S rRNA C967 or C1407 C5-methylase (RsmB/RsmF family)
VTIRQLIEDLQDLEKNMKRLGVNQNAEVVSEDDRKFRNQISGARYDEKTGKVVLA